MIQKRYPINAAMIEVLEIKRSAFASAQRELETAIVMALAAVDCPKGANLVNVEKGEIVVEIPETATE